MTSKSDVRKTTNFKKQASKSNIAGKGDISSLATNKPLAGGTTGGKSGGNNVQVIFNGKIVTPQTLLPRKGVTTAAATALAKAVQALPTVSTKKYLEDTTADETSKSFKK